MDKPSDYGSDIRGSNPLGGTTINNIYKLRFSSDGKVT